MEKITNNLKSKILLIISAMLAVTLVINYSLVFAAQPTVNLGTASPFAILAGTPNITDVANSSVIQGNVGMSPATGAGIGLLCSQVTGAIYSVDAAGPLPCRTTNGPLMVGAKNDLTTAYVDAAGRTPVTTVPSELGGTTKIAGVYDSSSTIFGITAGAGPLVLDGQNDPSSVFIFEAGFNGTGLVVGPGSTVSFINGASVCNVFWRVDTASINTTANFKGTVMALNSISVANGATIEGRLLARNGNVTLNNDTITLPPSCVTASSSSSGGSGSGSTTPGFPNTGLLSANNLVWAIIPLTVIIATLASIYLARKKHLL